MDQLVARLKKLTKVQIAIISVVGLIILAGIFGETENSQTANINTTNTSSKDSSQNEKTKTEVKTETTTEPIAFTATTQEDSSLSKGATKITTAGANGVKTLTYEVTYTDGKQTSKKLVKEEVTTQPVTQVTSIGTYVAPPPPPTQSSCDPNYTGGCVPVVSYDLDCPDIGFSVTVVGTDKHRFDGNGDGQGCESY